MTCTFCSQWHVVTERDGAGRPMPLCNDHLENPPPASRPLADRVADLEAELAVLRGGDEGSERP